ncbi:FHA domain-containing protein [Actinokineospora sp.]|uniref:FHA domain-containing protein n=1 Tax=Actinokineospora sp. TaxID=1872133 RepID=UPI00403802F8
MYRDRSRRGRIMLSADAPAGLVATVRQYSTTVREAGVTDRADEGRWLPRSHASLANGVSRATPGAIFALALTGGITVNPREDRTVHFGRNPGEVQVCVGEDDRQVSRRHGVLTYRRGLWWVGNLGKTPIGLPGARLLFSNEAPIPLAGGYTPLFVRGSRDREHLLELYVAGPDGGRPMPHPGDVTRPPKTWPLTPDERLVLIVLGQRYLRHEPHPQPLSRRQVADQMAELRPHAGWRLKRVEHMVADIRQRLSAAGVFGVVKEDIPEPIGNSLNHNLIRELMLTTTLVPQDLAILDERDP